MRITGKQCRAARALLKWNLHDLSSRTRVQPKRIDSFEKGMFHLHKGEHDEVLKVFEDAGIEFGLDFEVTLSGQKSANTGADLNVSHTIVTIDAKGHAETITNPAQNQKPETEEKPVNP